MDSLVDSEGFLRRLIVWWVVPGYWPARRHTIIPVFYGVKPAEIQWVESGKGVYAQALCELEEKKNADGQQRYKSEEIKKWKTALCPVAEIKGFEGEPYNK